jgi:hypothetical protein
MTAWTEWPDHLNGKQTLPRWSEINIREEAQPIHASGDAADVDTL